MENQASLGKRILQFPLVRMIIGMLVCLGVGAGGWELTGLLLHHTALHDQDIELFSGIVLAILIIISYIALFSRYEKRKVKELSAKHLTKNILGGILLGAGLQALIMLVMYLRRDFVILSVNPFVTVLPLIVLMSTAAITVEVLFIGIIFRITETWLGSWMAIAILTVLFWILHFFTPEGSWIASWGISMHAGFLLGAAYIFSRSLWLPIAIHFAWDFTSARIFGATEHGNIAEKTWLVSRISGPDWITGGFYGPQGSLQGALLCMTVGILFMIWNQRKNKIVPFTF